MVAPVTTIQRVLYNPTNFADDPSGAGFEYLTRGSGFYLGGLLISLAVGLVLVVLGVRSFERFETNLGEDL